MSSLAGEKINWWDNFVPLDIEGIEKDQKIKYTLTRKITTIKCYHVNAITVLCYHTKLDNGSKKLTLIKKKS